MEIFDNITKVVRDDIAEKATGKSRISIAAACFSIYAYKELKKQLEGVKDLRFIFTSPSFTTEKAPKEKREFYILAFRVNVAYMEPNLKSSSATSFHKRRLPKSAPSGSDAK